MSEDLRSELAYYKKLLDELAAQRISIEHHQWELHVQLRQKRQGFQLLSRLALSLGAHTDTASMFRVVVLALNSALEMDRTVIFVPGVEPDCWVAAHSAGLADDEARRIAELGFDLPAEVTRGVGLLVTRSSEETPLVSQLRGVFGLQTFACVPIAGHRDALGVLFSGRVGGTPSVIGPLDQGDIDTLRAISALLQAIAQNTHLTLFEQAERLKSEFYADLAHEFRTPLTLTLGPLAQILTGKWGDVPGPIREQLQVVERNQERILLLINQILDLARLEAGATELRAERIDDVNLLVRECVSHFRGAAEARELELRLSLDPELGTRPLLADRDKLERALFNLLSNALKFTDKGRIDVTTTLAAETLLISVADTGIGIPEDELPHVFDRFRRADTGGSRRSHGSGIGLALVKQMTELHQGSVSVESRKGMGARFRIELPFVSAKASPSPELPGTAAAPAPMAASRARPSAEASNRQAEAAFDPTKPIVLYVEDDADLCAHVSGILSDTYNVFLATDGHDGLAAAERYRPDAIVTDQMMPRMGGRALLAALKSHADLRSIPVVFLTAQYGTEGRIETLDAGADDYIGKPFHEAELRARIGNLIRLRSHERELVELNRRLQLQVRDQMARLIEAGELESFLPRPVLARLRRGPDGARPAPLRRTVTVLVSELSALAAFGEHGEEPTVAAILNEYLGAVSAICAARGGVIDGLSGGRVSVLFGLADGSEPKAAAWLAVQAAEEIRQCAARANADARRRGLRHESRSAAGIATGTCIVGAFGGEVFRAFTAIGPAVRAATRIHASADASSIVCDETTRALLGDRATFGKNHEVLALVSTSELPAKAPAVAPSRSSGSPERSFRREGEYWTVVYEGNVVRLGSSKGMLYLARLLAQPQVEIHVVELVHSTASGDPVERTLSAREAAELGLTVEPDTSAPLLDQRAKSAYRERLRDLEEALREATTLGDSVRATRIAEEKDAIARELATAVGLGGRDRNAAAEMERSRINVTRTVKAVLHKLQRACPELGRHLGASVRTGTFCVYAPPAGVPDAWDVSF